MGKHAQAQDRHQRPHHAGAQAFTFRLAFACRRRGARCPAPKVNQHPDQQPHTRQPQFAGRDEVPAKRARLVTQDVELRNVVGVNAALVSLEFIAVIGIDLQLIQARPHAKHGLALDEFQIRLPAVVTLRQDEWPVRLAHVRLDGITQPFRLPWENTEDQGHDQRRGSGNDRQLAPAQQGAGREDAQQQGQVSAAGRDDQQADDRRDRSQHSHEVITAAERHGHSQRRHEGQESPELVAVIEAAVDGKRLAAAGRLEKRYQYDAQRRRPERPQKLLQMITIGDQVAKHQVAHEQILDGLKALLTLMTKEVGEGRLRGNRTDRGAENDPKNQQDRGQGREPDRAQLFGEHAVQEQNRPQTPHQEVNDRQRYTLKAQQDFQRHKQA